MPAAPVEPRLRLIRERDTHRLVPSKYRERRACWRGLPETTPISGRSSTSSRPPTIGCSPSTSALPDIGPHELVFGVPSFHVINAAFCHAHPLGARFNGPDRGAWYAAFELRTAQAEVAFHRSVELAEIDWRADEVATYDDYLADFSAEFHDLRRDRRFAAASTPTATSRRRGSASNSSSTARSASSTQASADRAARAWPVSGPPSSATCAARGSTRSRSRMRSCSQ